jgi:predicted phosphohydrolase
MSLYTIADLHLSSFSDKRMDCFPGWEGYIEKLVDNWTKTVKDGDTIVVPGDIAWATKANDDLDSFRLLNDLPGKKILIKGNHDLWWKNSSNLHRIFSEFPSFTLNFLRNNSFCYNEYSICGCSGIDLTLNNQNEKINARNILRLARSLESAEKGFTPIVFMHFPPIMYENGSLIMSDECIEIFSRHGVTDCYYGHLHCEDIKYSYNDVYNGVKFHLISADFVQFKPVLVV